MVQESYHEPSIWSIAVKNLDFERYRTRPYREALQRLLDRGILSPDSKILVLCAGEIDRQVHEALGFSNVTLSNLSKNLRPEEFAPFRALSLDAENIRCENNEYDFCVVHAGLHHCASPHRALLEMYRVARIGLLAIEPRDSAFGRLMLKLNLGQEFEVASTVGKEEFRGGGLRFGGIPNYIYRFTRREIMKCIETNSPYARHKYLFNESVVVPWNRYRRMKNRLISGFAALARNFDFIIQRLPFVANIIAFAVIKPNLPGEIHPWLHFKEGTYSLNQNWVRRNYR